MENKNTDELLDEVNQSNLSQSTPHTIGGRKRKDNKLAVKMMFIAAAVLLLGILGLKIYQNFFAEEVKEEAKEIKDSQAQASRARTDLGRNFDPIENTVITVGGEKNENPNVVGTVESQKADVPPPKSGFQKYLSIPITNTSSQNNRSANKSTENTESTDSEPRVKAKASQSNKAANSDTSMKAAVIKLDPNLYVEANQVIPCALTTSFISDVAGRINCVITEDVWSANHNVKLIEKGTKAFGHYQTGTLRQGQGRMFILWDQLRTPDFKKIMLVDTAASGALGEAGINGWIDTHFWERFGGAMMLSVVQDVAAAVADQAVNKDRNVDYTENSREAMASMAKVALENSINIPPTMYRNQGDIIGILIGDDIDFSDVYELKAK